MSPALVQRQAALAGVALIAAIGALALGRLEEDDPGETPTLPAAVADWEKAVASPYRPAYGNRTACGVEPTPATRGIAHPVLPCGVDIFVYYRGRVARAEVIDRGPQGSDREFDLTEALANDVGLSGIQVIRWSFAG